MDKERKDKAARAQDAEADGIIEGRNAVIEALRAGASIDKIFIQKGETDKTLGHIASTARAAGGYCFLLNPPRAEKTGGDIKILYQNLFQYSTISYVQTVTFAEYCGKPGPILRPFQRFPQGFQQKLWKTRYTRCKTRLKC